MHTRHALEADAGSQMCFGGLPGQEKVPGAMTFTKLRHVLERGLR